MNELAVKENKVFIGEFNNEKKELLKQTICKGATDDELELFIYACQRTGLDPFMKQVHPVKRWDSSLKREVMTIQTSIDGYRLIAERTGRYAPGKETSFGYDKEGKLFSATAYVKKQTSDGTWHEVSATAFWAEYCAMTKEGKPTHMWSKLPHAMLSKCAEALALRKSFPADMSGIYTADEMQQASNKKIDALTYDQCEALEALVDCDNHPEELKNTILNRCGVKSFEDIPQAKFDAIIDWAKKRRIRQEELIEIATTDTIEAAI